MRPWGLVIVIAGFTVLLASQVAAGPAAQRAEPWQLLTIFEAGSRRFGDCVVEAQYAGGLVLAFQRDRKGRLSLTADAPRLLLKVGTDRKVILSVDRDFQRQVPAKAVTPTSLSFAVGADPAIAVALEQGRTLSLDVAGEPAGRELAYDLDGAAAALGSVARCSRENTIALHPGPTLRILDRIASGPIQMSRPIDSGANGAEETGFAWTTDSVAGAARETTLGFTEDFLDLVLARMDRMGARCQGHLSPELEAPIEADGTVSEAGTAICPTAGEDRFAALLFVRLGSRFLEFELETDSAKRGDAIAMRNRIAALVREKLPL